MLLCTSNFKSPLNNLQVSSTIERMYVCRSDSYEPLIGVSYVETIPNCACVSVSNNPTPNQTAKPSSILECPSISNKICPCHV